MNEFRRIASVVNPENTGGPDPPRFVRTFAGVDVLEGWSVVHSEQCAPG